LSKSPPVLITTFKVVPPGTNGTSHAYSCVRGNSYISGSRWPVTVRNSRFGSGVSHISPATLGNGLSTARLQRCNNGYHNVDLVTAGEQCMPPKFCSARHPSCCMGCIRWTRWLFGQLVPTFPQIRQRSSLVIARSIPCSERLCKKHDIPRPSRMFSRTTRSTFTMKTSRSCRVFAS
jgi:hypothetical protein